MMGMASYFVAALVIVLIGAAVAAPVINEITGPNISNCLDALIADGYYVVAQGKCAATNLNPCANITYDLGTDELWWDDSYISQINVSSTGLLFYSGGTQVVKIWPGGHIQGTDGFSTESALYGPAVVTYDYGESTPLRTDGTSYFDLADDPNGNNIFKRVSGTSFTQNDADSSLWIVLWGENFGAYAEIIRYIDGNTVELDTMGWNQDFPTQFERIFKIFISRTGNTGMEIDGKGIIRLPYLGVSPGTPVNGMIWMESDGLHMYRNGTEYTVAGL